MVKLNPQQKAAVEYLGTPVLVLAGAGSGKTRVITEKIAYLIRHHQIAARHIAAITFTNKAAREMRERVGKLLSRDEAHGLHVSTFHTLGLTIIRQELAALGFKPGFSLFDATDSLTLLKELLRKEGDSDADAARFRISLWKNDFLSPEQALAAAEDVQAERHARLYQRYQRQLKAYNALDFDDLIALPVHLFQYHPDLREAWQNRLRYLLIDEYQDTNACQYQLVKLLAGVQGRLTAVGDDDQSIYAWRGARPENLAQLQQDYPNLHVIKLEQNYRSTDRILKSANHLIALNPHVFEKKLWSALGAGENPRALACDGTEHEAERVVSEILRLKFKHRCEYGDFAILYRGNHQARPFERKLREQGIPYKVSGGDSFFERSEIKDVVGYLRLLANPDDDAAFLRVVNTPRREIGATTLEKLAAYANERHVSLIAASSELGLAGRLSERALFRLRGFTDFITQLARRALTGEPLQITRELLRELAYEDWLLEISSHPKAAERRMDNVNELLAWIGRLGRDSEKGPGKALHEIVTHLTLMDILERNESDKGEGVQLLTLHAAKGLEFPHVFIAGMEEDILPHKSSLETGSIEEERRLAYVGITRARRTLTFTYARKRQKYGEETECEPSRFLTEIPADLLDWETETATQTIASPDARRALLESLKQRLTG